MMHFYASLDTQTYLDIFEWCAFTTAYYHIGKNIKYAIAKKRVYNSMLRIKRKWQFVSLQ